MKKFISIIAIVLIIVVSVIPAFATSESDLLSDGADLFSDTEESSLLNHIFYIRDTYNFDVTVVTVDSLDIPIINFADDYTPIVESNDGVVFVINMDSANGGSNRGYFSSTRNDAIEIFSPDALAKIDNDIPSYLTRGDYYDGVEEYLNLTEKFIESYSDGTPYEATLFDSNEFWFSLFVAVIISIILAFVITAGMKKAMNTAIKKTVAHEYKVDGSLNMTVEEDTYLYENTTKTKIETSSGSGGGGGGTRTNSSGGTRGGGGGRF